VNEEKLRELGDQGRGSRSGAIDDLVDLARRTDGYAAE
jgi:hypothetical protein